MPHQVEIVADQNLVRVTLHGELTMADHEAARADAVSTLKEAGLSRLFVDATKAQPKMTPVDDFEFTSSHAKHQPIGLKTAVLHLPEASDHFRFIENVGTNRGQTIKAFSDEATALDWLLDIGASES